MATEGIEDFISNQRKAGATDDAIREHLLGKGYSVGDINGAIARVTLSNSPFASQARRSSLMNTLMERPKGHAGNTVLQLVLIFILIAAAPGAYGLITAVVVPAIKGQPVKTANSLEGYDLLKDVPQNTATLIPSVPSAGVKSGGSTGGSNGTGSGLSYAGGSTQTPASQPTPAPAAGSSLPEITLTATPTSVAAGGRVEISWSAKNATSCNGNGFKTFSKTSGSNSFLIYSPRTFTITCSNETSLAEKSIDIFVNGTAPAGGSGGGSGTGSVGPGPAPVPAPAPQPPPPPEPAPDPKPVPGGVLVTTVAQLKAELAKAKGGDTILLAAGSWGDVSLSGNSFTSDVTIRSQSASTPAQFRSLNLTSCSHLNFKEIQVYLQPKSDSTLSENAVRLVNCPYFTLADSSISSGPAINGIDPDGTVTDSTHNVKGYPMGYGIGVNSTSNVTIERNEFFTFYKGIVLNKATNVLIKGNSIHNLRTTPIDGSGLQNIVVDGNTMGSSHPWHWGSGDHGDMLHFWNQSSDTGPVTGIVIKNNIMKQGDGVAVLGIALEDFSGQGFSGVVIDNNAILNGNSQGIRLPNTWNSTISNNVLLQTSGDSKDAPGILLRTGGVVTNTKGHNVLSNNLTAFIDDRSKDSYNKGGSGYPDPTNTLTNNKIVQMTKSGTPGYYDSSLISAVNSMTDASSIYSYANGHIALAPLDKFKAFLARLNAKAMLAAVFSSLFK